MNLSCFVSSLCSIDPSFCFAFGSDLHFVNIVKTPLPKDYRFPPIHSRQNSGKGEVHPANATHSLSIPPHPRTGNHSPPIPYLLIRYRNAQRSLMSISHRTLTIHTLNPPASPPWGESSLSGRAVCLCVHLLSACAPAGFVKAVDFASQNVQA